MCVASDVLRARARAFVCVIEGGKNGEDSEPEHEDWDGRQRKKEKKQKLRGRLYMKAKERKRRTVLRRGGEKKKG